MKENPMQNFVKRLADMAQTHEGATEWWTGFHPNFLQSSIDEFEDFYEMHCREEECCRVKAMQVLADCKLWFRCFDLMKGHVAWCDHAGLPVSDTLRIGPKGYRGRSIREILGNRYENLMEDSK